MQRAIAVCPHIAIALNEHDVEEGRHRRAVSLHRPGLRRQDRDHRLTGRVARAQLDAGPAKGCREDTCQGFDGFRRRLSKGRQLRFRLAGSQGGKSGAFVQTSSGR